MAPFLSDAPDLGGLRSDDARARLLAEGANALPETPPQPLYRRFLAQFKGALSLLLLGAVALDFSLWLVHGGTPTEPLAILLVLLLNSVLGVVQEYRSERALAEIRALGAPVVQVRRDGEWLALPAEQLVRDDVVRVSAGDRIPADGTVVREASLAVDESVLTGESVPADKGLDAEVLSGTLVARGNAVFRVTQTGPRSAMGRLAESLIGIQSVRTPLERRLDAFGRQIAIVVGSLSVFLAALGLLSEGWDRLGVVVTFAVAFAVAVVPEGMPAVLTLSLAIGVQRMARRKAIVRRLAAVEALGSVTIIATDKTGTLTENRMSVAELFAPDEEALLRAGVLANDADVEGGGGDPLDVALLSQARARGLDPRLIREENPRLSTRPFDSAWKFMRATVETEAGAQSYLKGAVETLLERAQGDPDELQRFRQWAEAQAGLGRRVIALGRADGQLEHGLEILGLLAVWDPPRQEVAGAVRVATEAGVRLIMVTGDHPATARAIAERVGIPTRDSMQGVDLRTLSDKERQARVRTVDLVARASPQDKLLIVEALQAGGETVAMTGDGVNDAPALKRADVGMAMGNRGSDVAREVSDLVLLDDNFATIVNAIEEGRNIYENIQKFIRFTFSTNVALSILVIGGAVGSYLLGLRDSEGALVLPLTAVQILFINFVGDGPPALALALDRSPTVMQRPPRPGESPLLDRAALEFIVKTGILQGGVGLALLALLPRLGLDLGETRTAVFVYEAVAKVLSAYPARRVGGRARPNHTLHAAVGFGILLALGSVQLPAACRVLGLSALSSPALLVVGVAAAGTWVAVEGMALLSRRVSGA